MSNVELTVLSKAGHATFALQMWEDWVETSRLRLISSGSNTSILIS